MGAFELMSDAGPSLLEPATFATRFVPHAPHHPAVKALHQLLVSLLELPTLEARADWLEELVHWLDGRRALPVVAEPGEPRRTARLRLLLRALEELPQCRAALLRTVQDIVSEGAGVRLFTETGMPGVKGFLGEAVDRLSRRVLPEPPDDRDLAQLLGRLFRTERDARWLETLHPDLVQLGQGLFKEGQRSAFAPLQAPMREAVLVLAARLCAYGLADDLRARSPQVPVDQSPFLKLRRAVDALAADHANGMSHEVTCREAIGECRQVVRAVIAKLDESGVSVDLVYRLELISKNLDRLYALLRLVGTTEAVSGAGYRFFISLVRGAARDRSLGELLQRNSRQLARKVIERAGHGGEHYITSTHGEYHRMVSSAAGGGMLTTFTTLAKFALSGAALPPFFEGLFASLNYAGSFIVMQLCGFTLATKQPSMTAAALAGSIHETAKEHEPDPQPLVTQIARIVRSQLAAAFGNLGMVMPVSIAVELLMRLTLGHGLLPTEKARYVVHSLHLFKSWTIPFAALTGVFLWVASVGAGAIENWAVYRKLPEAIARSRTLRRLVGPERARKTATFFLDNVSGFGGNTTLGFLLGMTSALGKFFGVPLDVRHVTLSTCALTFAGLTLGAAEVIQPDFLWAVAGIAMIGVLNFGVSFALALTVALRAREVSTRGQFQLFRAVLARFRKNPLEFFVPPPPAPEIVAPK